MGAIREDRVVPNRAVRYAFEAMVSGESNDPVVRAEGALLLHVPSVGVDLLMPRMESCGSCLCKISQLVGCDWSVLSMLP